MNEFERQLQECLEALTEGRWDLDECVRRYPEHADELRTQLLMVQAVSNAYNVDPDAQWAQDARRRFLIATGQTIAEATDIEPSPSFFAAARVRFLLAAQRLRKEGAAQPKPRRVPLFGSPMRAFGAVAAAVVLFFGISSYTVATADAALPGDWQYSIKLQKERVRLALAFSEDSKQEVKLDIAEERLHEIEQLAAKGRIIGPGELDRLVSHTQPLVDAAAENELNTEDAARLQEVTARGVEVLDTVEPQVDPDALAQLEEAKNVSATGVSVTRDAVVAVAGRQPVVITPEVPLQLPPRTPEPEPTEAPDTPTAEPTTDATDATQEPVETPREPSDDEELTDAVVLDGVSIDLGDVALYRMTAGQLTMLVPGSQNGWYLDNLPQSGVPTLLSLRTQDQQSFVVVSTGSGDMYWYVSPTGDSRFDEVQMRITRDGQVFIPDPAELRARYGAVAEIPILMMQSIDLLPEPVAVDDPAPTDTVTPE
jgi:hypothetical protein